jgi:hypothetical protein
MASIEASLAFAFSISASSDTSNAFFHHVGSFPGFPCRRVGSIADPARRLARSGQLVGEPQQLVAPPIQLADTGMQRFRIPSAQITESRHQTGLTPSPATRRSALAAASFVLYRSAEAIRLSE